ncbi:hypothetical protein BLNAU_1144 [Blattamonas nauphoetae]|uniref:Uncharacterized protein n=1 Tax=Blattamonas nauphoetae TaxID=2049346 RepID=A0ABQ9YJZ3_9EUKA|nr:hypothetical protein BLNAU_1144 [Blattamonas nauphoetae]
MRDFVANINVLLSSTNKTMITASMKMLKSQSQDCSNNHLLALVKADLIPQLIATLNPQSVSLSDCAYIHTYLMDIIIHSVWWSTPTSLTYLGIEDRDEQQAVREVNQTSTNDEVWIVVAERKARKVSGIAFEGSEYRKGRQVMTDSEGRNNG